MRERCSYLLELHGVETSIIPLVVAPMVAAVLSMGTITIAVSLIWSPSGTFAAVACATTAVLAPRDSQCVILIVGNPGLPPLAPCPERMYTREG